MINSHIRHLLHMPNFHFKQLLDHKARLTDLAIILATCFVTLLLIKVLIGM